MATPFPRAAPPPREPPLPLSSGLAKALAIAQAFAATPEPILLLGERGTGKTVLARAIHDLSGRTGSFVTCQLGAAADSLIADELFGHSKGAYTGAFMVRVGRVASAAAGTLFLDEIAEATPSIQALLLSLFDPAGMYRLGEDRRQPVTARVIAATNGDLVSLARAGRFRQDLLDRFGFARITLPPLRDRRDEIPSLFDAFWRRERPDDPAPSPSSEVRDILLTAPWPGNLRELANLVRYLAVVAPDGRVTLSHLPPDFDSGDPRPTKRRLDRHRLLEALQRTGGNRSETARILGIHRRTVARFLRRHAATVTVPAPVSPLPSDMSQ